MPSRRAYIGAVGGIVGTLTGCIGSSGAEKPSETWRSWATGDGGSGSDIPTWSPQAKLAADIGGPDDEFGHAIAVAADRSTAVVGAPNDDNPYSPAAGSAYVFRRAGGKWRQTAALLAQEGPAETAFGSDLAIDDTGDSIIVGAPGESGGGTAYRYRFTEGDWTEHGRLRPATDAGAVVGHSVALTGDGSTAVVGTTADESAGTVFTTSTATSAPMGVLPGTDGRPTSVEVTADGGTVVVGTTGTDDRPGTVLEYESTDSGWVVANEVRPEESKDVSTFGSAVGLDAAGTTLLVAASSDPAAGGSVSAYSKTAGQWTRTDTLTARSAGPDRFGASVAVSADGSHAAVGAPLEDTREGTASGVSYVFGADSGSWDTLARLVQPDSRDAGDRFGCSVTLADDGNAVLVGACQDTEPNGPGAGSASVFSQ